MPFPQKVCAVCAHTRYSLLYLFFILAHFTALMREQERLVADVKCTLLGLGDESWSLESPLADNHVAWAFLMLWANGFFRLLYPKNRHYFYFCTHSSLSKGNWSCFQNR